MSVCFLWLCGLQVSYQAYVQLMSLLLTLVVNPDSVLSKPAYKVAGQLQKIRKTTREEWLLAHLMSLPPSRDGLCVDYAYYDLPSASAVRPSICDDLEYDAHLREVVSRVGVE